MTPFANFVAEMRATPCLADMADGFAEAHRAIELESIHNAEARKFLKMQNWIFSQPRTLGEKLGALEKLTSLPPGPRIVRLKQLTGW